MRSLQNILDIDQFSSLISEGRSAYSSLPWWDDCISPVKLQLFTDKTTSHDNLRQKARVCIFAVGLFLDAFGHISGKRTRSDTFSGDLFHLMNNRTIQMKDK